MILTIRRQQRVLAAMHSSLHDSDPHLVNTFGTFTRYTAGEQMPRIERVRVCPPAWLRSGGRPRELGLWLHALVFIPVAIALLLVLVLLGRNGAQARCTVPRVAGQSAGRAVAAPWRAAVRGGLACLFPCGRAHLLSLREQWLGRWNDDYFADKPMSGRTARQA